MTRPIKKLELMCGLGIDRKISKPVQILVECCYRTGSNISPGQYPNKMQTTN